MSAKRKTLRNEAKAGSKTRREIISTCQIKTNAGTPVTWTAFRRVGAPASARPDCYICTLPDNTADEASSSYNLRAIAVQAKRFVVNVTALDRDVVYVVTRGGGTPESIPVARGEVFPVPARGSGDDVTTVVLTFEGDYCTIEAVPVPPTTRVPATTTREGEEPGPMMPMNSDGEPPPPLPGQDGEN